MSTFTWKQAAASDGSPFWEGDLKDQPDVTGQVIAHVNVKDGVPGLAHYNVIVARDGHPSRRSKALTLEAAKRHAQRLLDETLADTGMVA